MLQCLRLRHFDLRVPCVKPADAAGVAPFRRVRRLTVRCFKCSLHERAECSGMAREPQPTDRGSPALGSATRGSRGGRPRAVWPCTSHPARSCGGSGALEVSGPGPSSRAGRSAYAMERLLRCAARVSRLGFCGWSRAAGAGRSAVASTARSAVRPSACRRCRALRRSPWRSSAARACARRTRRAWGSSWRRVGSPRGANSRRTRPP